VCLLVLAWEAHPRFRLIVAANRDEFHDRPAAPLAPWPAPADILAGRDLRAGGTWLALDRRRRFGALTNSRDRMPAPPAAPSRGELIPQYLLGEGGAREYLAGLEPRSAAYAGFNLLLGDDRSLWYACNRCRPFARELTAGIYGLANERLEDSCAKLRRVRRRFESWLAGRGTEIEELLAMLEDGEPAAEAHGPPGGAPPGEWERILSAPFVKHPRYGTRCSTVLALEPAGELRLIERRFGPAGDRTGQSEYRLARGQWPALARPPAEPASPAASLEGLQSFP
jgi:uncharacterized protein with NRDE domain